MSYRKLVLQKGAATILHHKINGKNILHWKTYLFLTEIWAQPVLPNKQTFTLSTNSSIFFLIKIWWAQPVPPNKPIFTLHHLNSNMSCNAHHWCTPCSFFFNVVLSDTCTFKWQTFLYKQLFTNNYFTWSKGIMSICNLIDKGHARDKPNILSKSTISRNALEKNAFGLRSRLVINYFQ